MCGRFTLTLPDYETLARALGVDFGDSAAASGLYRPRYNVAPTEAHWILRTTVAGARELVPARWGLVNHWAKDPSAAPKQINARSETVLTKPSFREAFERRRCVVPADGFFEWTGAKGRRRPIWYHHPEGRLLHLAGVYESWRDPATGERVRTFAIVTTRANELVAEVHDRMPALIDETDVARYLAHSVPDAAALLRPAPAGVLVGSPASTRVNTVGFDDPSCLRPEADEQMSLF